MYVGGKENPNLMRKKLSYIESLCIPSIGDIWHWEPMRSWASQRIKVIEVKWDDDGECHIAAVQSDGRLFGWGTDILWNDLSRFIQACVLVTSAKDIEIEVELLSESPDLIKEVSKLPIVISTETAPMEHCKDCLRQKHEGDCSRYWDRNVPGGWVEYNAELSHHYVALPPNPNQ